MRDDTKSILYYSGGIICAITTGYIYKLYSTYYDYEKGVKDNEIDTPHSLIKKEKENEEFKDPNYKGKMVYVSGFALKDKYYSSLLDSLEKIDNELPS